MDIRKFVARKEKWLRREVAKWARQMELRPGQRVKVSGQITFLKSGANVSFYQRHTTSPVIKKKVSKATLDKIGRMTDFNEGQQRIMNILLSSQNQPTTRRELVDRGCDITHIDQINGILGKKEIPVAIRAEEIKSGNSWSKPLCFRHVDRSIKP